MNIMTQRKSGICLSVQINAAYRKNKVNKAVNVFLARVIHLSKSMLIPWSSVFFSSPESCCLLRAEDNGKCHLLSFALICYSEQPISVVSLSLKALKDLTSIQRVESEKKKLCHNLSVLKVQCKPKVHRRGIE